MSTKTGSSKKRRTSRLRKTLELDALKHIALEEPKFELELVKAPPLRAAKKKKPDKELLKRKKRGKEIYERFRKYTEEHRSDPMPVGRWPTESEEEWIWSLKEKLDKFGDAKAVFGVIASVEFGLNEAHKTSLRLRIMTGDKSFKGLELSDKKLETFLANNIVRDVTKLFRMPCLIMEDILEHAQTVRVLEF